MRQEIRNVEVAAQPGRWTQRNSKNPTKSKPLDFLRRPYTAKLIALPSPGNAGSAVRGRRQRERGDERSARRGPHGSAEQHAGRVRSPGRAEPQGR